MSKDTSKSPGAPEVRAITGNRRHIQMFETAPEGESWNVHLTKAVKSSQALLSAQKANTGIVSHPFEWSSAKRFKSADPHHSSCMEAKIGATVGLGFEKESVADILDPMCLFTWQDCISAVAEDFWTVGNGYIEVVREGEEIVGLFHIAAENVHIEIENGSSQSFHYRIRQEEGIDTIAAPFGEKAEFIERRPSGLSGGMRVNFDDPDRISEIIHIRRPSALHRWYGMPDWLAAVAQIELAQCITQYNYDFFLNNGVPEFIFMIAGADLGDTWEKEIKPALKKTTGIGNAHSTLAVNIPHKDIEWMVEKLGTEMGEGWFQEMLDTVAVRIVTAHRVPPIIAGVQIPGKLGANNEHVNAMWLFQGLVIGPAQKVFSSCLSNTLGSEMGVDGLGGESDFKLLTIPDTIPTARVEAPASPTEPAREVGTRRDIPGTSQEPTPQERQAAGLAKRLKRAREELGDEVVDAILDKTLMVMAADALSSKADVDEAAIAEEFGGSDEPSQETVAEGNPYKVVKRGSSYCVVKTSTGKTVPGGCHSTKAKAMRHWRALEAATADE